MQSQYAFIVCAFPAKQGLRVANYATTEVDDQRAFPQLDVVLIEPQPTAPASIWRPMSAPFKHYLAFKVDVS